MAKPANKSTCQLLDAVRPLESDGRLISAILSTYGLSLDQPKFFEHDFLPTLLGLGGFRDRGNVSTSALERKLADSYCALICDAHAVAAGVRPSLQVDVIPIARPRQHSKIVLIHRARLIRVIVSSANLTHDGYRSQREAAALLDFRPEGGLDPAILREMIDNWIDVLGANATQPLREALDKARSASARWLKRPSKIEGLGIRIVHGGGSTPLWRQITDSWPSGEPVLSWLICSPFWPGADSRINPFESIAQELGRRQVSLSETEIELICPADVPGDRARPVFPFTILRDLRDRGFPVKKGRIIPARLEALEDEVPERKAEGNRSLHAKVILLRGPRTAVGFIGSANFTNTGLGVSPGSNLEAGILLTCPVSLIDEQAWRPPVVLDGAIDWAKCGAGDMENPVSEPDDPIDWPIHLRSVELDIHWESGANPGGTLHVAFSSTDFPRTAFILPDKFQQAMDICIETGSPTGSSQFQAFPLPHSAVYSLLARRTVEVRWGDPAKSAGFPINIKDAAKSGLPAVLGAHPDEQQLLDYFQGRIGEDDLLAQLEKQAGTVENLLNDTGDRLSRDLQNYIVREFVESLYGMEDLLKAATYSTRALETSLLGEFSPTALAERIFMAMRSGRRSATAAAFQITELIRVVSTLPSGEGEASQEGLGRVIEKAIHRMMRIVEDSASNSAFLEAISDPHFKSYVKASLPRGVGSQFLQIAGGTVEPEIPGEGV